MIYYEDLVEKTKSIEKSIFSKMKTTDKNVQEYDVDCFCKHLILTKQWFLHISWTNKKQFLISLIKELDIQTVAQLLKSIWNCRTKDMFLSTSQRSVLTSYDQVPLDNNRTAQPESNLNEVIVSETQRFMSLDAVHKTLYLSELLTVVGGPLMLEVLKCCQKIYDHYAEEQELLEAVLVTEAQEKLTSTVAEQPKKDQTQSQKGSVKRGTSHPKNIEADQEKKEPRKEQTQRQKGSVPRGTSHAINIGADHEQKDLEALLASWSAKMKSIRDSIKLQEMEVTLKNGTKRCIWRNKPSSDSQESVDMIQLLPSYIGKKIFMYLPPSQWPDCAQVNKYWAYLVDEIRSEITTRNKLTIEMNKMQDNIIRHNILLDIETPAQSPMTSTSTIMTTNRMKNIKRRSKKLKTKKPILNIAQLNAQLNRRGAADGRMWTWCAKILKFYEENNAKESEYKGLSILGDGYFPCPLMEHNINLPLNPPLNKDPAKL